jgi:hypothetical protein
MKSIILHQLFGTCVKFNWISLIRCNDSSFWRFFNDFIKISPICTWSSSCFIYILNENFNSFIHFFDGMRTSYQIQDIELWNYGQLKIIVSIWKIKRISKVSLKPESSINLNTMHSFFLLYVARIIFSNKIFKYCSKNVRDKWMSFLD